MIESKVLKFEYIRWRELQWFQGELKELSKKDFEKLKQSLKTKNFIDPFKVWQDESGLLFILDGRLTPTQTQMLRNGT